MLTTIMNQVIRLSAASSLAVDVMFKKVILKRAVVAQAV
jgi:hypothetical protein